MDQPTAPVEYMHEKAVLQNIRNHVETAYKMHALSADVIFKVQNPITTYHVRDEQREAMDP